MMISASGQEWIEHSNGLIPPTLEGGNTELEFYDVNLDGNIDLLSIGDHGSPYINTDQHGVMVWFGDGAGNWSVYQNGNFGYGGIAVGDVNNDGFPDVGYGMHHDYSSNDFGDQLIEVALGDGTGMNWTPWDDGLATNGEDYGMFGTDFADIDADGDLDIASASFGASSGMHVYRNNGDGTWTQTYGFVGGNSNLYIEFGDLNGDGYPDIASCTSVHALFLNDGTGDFIVIDGGGITPQGNLGYYDIAMGDVDNDGKDELAIAANGVMEMWKLNDDEETWSDMSHELRSYPDKQAIDITDMNSDGFLDVVGYGSGNVHIFFGYGGNSWQLVYSLSTPDPGTARAFTASADVDRNGYCDIALINQEEISWWNYRNFAMFFMETTAPDTMRVVPIYPRGYETILGGSTGWIEWMSEVPGDQITAVRIELSANGHDGDYMQIADSLPNNEKYQLIWPDFINSDSCYLKMTVVGQDSASAITPAAFSIISDITGVVEESVTPSKASVKTCNYPNPFNASTIISYSLNENSTVLIEIYDLLGRKIETLAEDHQPGGSNQVVWDAGDYSSGIYFYRIQTAEYVEMRKIVLLK
jgi:hypothetical protein